MTVPSVSSSDAWSQDAQRNIHSDSVATETLMHAIMHAILSQERYHPIMTTAEHKGDRFLEGLAHCLAPV
jgi:hypothetical protein